MVTAPTSAPCILAAMWSATSAIGSYSHDILSHLRSNKTSEVVSQKKQFLPLTCLSQLFITAVKHQRCLPKYF